MAITRLNSLAIPAGTVVSADLTYPLTTFSSTGIDDNATSTAITIDASENVGIGTTSPLNKLVVSEGTGQHGIELAPGTTSYIQAYDRAIADYGDLKIDAQIIQFGTDNGTERMRIDSSGNVGIGTTNPLQLLHISKASADNYIRLGSNGANDAGIYFNTGTDWTIGTDTSNSNAFDLSNSSTVGGASKLVVTTGGNVGIGTTSPNDTNGFSRALDVNGVNGAALYTRTNGSTTNQTLFGNFGDSGYINNKGSGSLLFYNNNNTERMRIDSSGNVGVGTTSINARLNVVATSGEVFRADASGGAYRIVANQTGVNMNGNVGIGTTSPASKLEISGTGTGAWVTLDRQDSGTNLVDFTQSGTRLGYIGYSANNLYLNNATASNTIFNTSNTERMRIDASGNLLIGTTTSPNGSADGIKFNAGSSGRVLSGGITGSFNQFVFFNPNGQVGAVVTNGSATTYNTSSDVRLKENIVDAPAGNIDAIRVRSFDWKADGSHQTYGMVAQELVDVAPEAVTQGETDDDMWQVDYSKLVPMMIKEIQDLKAEVAALKGA